VALLLISGFQSEGLAQVVEEREKTPSNPGKVIFRTTLYGGATGLVLGGAYALIEDDDDLSTGEILKWGVAGGVAAGFLIGLIYVVARPEPKGDVEDLETEDGGEEQGALPRLISPTIMLAQRQDLLGNAREEVELNLVTLRF
jgi:hypothetical protein